MSNYQNYQPSNEDTSASTQMFRAFKDEPVAQSVTAPPSESRRTGIIAASVIIGLVVVIGVVYLAFK
jgi:hypothetical protein